MMQMIADQIKAVLPEGTAPEVVESVDAGVASLGMFQLLAIIADAERARDLLDLGDQDGARAILAPYQDVAAAAGMGAAFDALTASLGL